MFYECLEIGNGREMDGRRTSNPNNKSSSSTAQGKTRITVQLNSPVASEKYVTLDNRAGP